MLKAYRNDEADWSTGGALKEGIIWIDLIDPNDEEKREVERIVGIRVPSSASLSEIEASSRLVFERDVLYLSSPAVRINDGGEAELTPIGFIVNKTVLVTVRFSALPAFDAVIKRIAADHDLQTGMCVFTALTEAIVDRGADVLEHLGAEADKLSRSVFKGGMDKRRKGPVRATRRLREALSNVGVLADRLAMARDVLLGVGRIASYANDVAEEWITKSSKHRLQAVLKDVASLSDYETRLSDKIQMLLDAVLGFINIEQNDLFKILTIVSVVGVPPTLLAGIWGMNFKHMPELDWAWGYPLAWLAMILSGIVPLVWFRLRGWWE